MKIIALCATLLFFLVACAPLRPLAPQQYRTDAPYFDTITGIDSWDKVLLPWVGTPYLYGGTTKNGTDCSGFVSSVYKEKEGINIPRTSVDGYKNGKPVNRQDLTIGDLVFFGEKSKVSHVGIYVGEGKFIHASTSLGVTVTPLSDSYWVPRYMGARRYL